MVEKRHICFRGRIYVGYDALAESWNSDKPEFLHAKPRNVAMNIRNWKKRNPGIALTDDAIERCLTTRAARNAINFRGRYYNGPADLFRALGDASEISYKGFHLNLSNWRADNPGVEPADDDIEQFAAAIRIETPDGRRIGREREVWENLPEPKVSWSMLANKLVVFRKERSRSPTPEEIIEMAQREREWMERTGDPRYQTLDGHQITREEFFDLFVFERVDIGTWFARLRRFKNRTERKPTAEEAIELMRPWGVVDRAVGILYRWTNKVDGKIYIGVTTETLEERVRGHVRTVDRGDMHPDGLHRAIVDFGIDEFQIEELARFESLEELAEAERQEIEIHDCLAPKGYNLTCGGKGLALNTLPLPFRGKKYKNPVALADDHRMPVKRLESRLRLGWTLDEAVDIPKGMQREKPYHLLSESTISQLAREHGLDSGKVYARISDYGWTLDEALGIVDRPFVHVRAKSVVVGDLEFRSNAQAAKHFGINEGTWSWRRIRGWSPEQAAGLEPPPRKKRDD